MPEEQTATAVDDSLDQLMEEHGLSDEQESTTERTRDERGRYASTESDENSESDADAELDPTEVETAMEAMRRYGMSEAQREALKKSDPEEFLAFGKKLAKIQSDTDEYTKKHHALEGELKALKERDDGKPAEQPSHSEWSKELDALKEYFNEEEMVSPLRNAIAGLENAMSSRFESKLSELDSLVSELAYAQARLSLIDEFPQLKEDDRFAAVVDRADRIKGDGMSKTALLREAAMWELAPEMLEEAKSAKVKEYKRRDDGTPSGGGKPSKTKGISEYSVDELNDKALEAQMDGKTDLYNQIVAEIRKKRNE